ncbi:MAG: type 1 glutamine amidotransferase [Actinobacteria bacterium]|nr:type 1 glutamine amidotransferase [Actinomycetota bacterium]
MRPILCIRNQTDAPLGIAADVFASVGAPYRYLDAWRAADWPRLEDVSAVVVLGGGMNAQQFDEHPWLRDIYGFVDKVLERGVPLFGICLGAQILARALGAEVRPSPVREIGFHPVVATDDGRADPVIDSFASGMRVFQWHEDAFELPDGAKLLYSSFAVPYQAFRYGDRVYATQFHFEVTPEIIARWSDDTDPEAMEKYWGVNPKGLLDEAARHLPRQQEAGRRTMSSFVDLVRSLSPGVGVKP